jgi:hypothetical protein
MASIAEIYGTDDDYRPGDRIPALERVHKAVDFAEYASQEDFVEQCLPVRDRFTVEHLSVLSALLRRRRMSFLADFVDFYAENAEASVAQAYKLGEHEIAQVGKRQAKHLRWYMPSPLRLWGDWRDYQGRRRGHHEARQAAGRVVKVGAAIP